MPVDRYERCVKIPNYRGQHCETIPRTNGPYEVVNLVALPVGLTLETALWGSLVFLGCAYHRRKNEETDLIMEGIGSLRQGLAKAIQDYVW